MWCRRTQPRLAAGLEACQLHRRPDDAWPEPGTRPLPALADWPDDETGDWLARCEQAIDIGGIDDLERAVGALTAFTTGFGARLTRDRTAATSDREVQFALRLAEEEAAALVTAVEWVGARLLWPDAPHLAPAVLGELNGDRPAFTRSPRLDRRQSARDATLARARLRGQRTRGRGRMSRALHIPLPRRARSAALAAPSPRRIASARVLRSADFSIDSTSSVSCWPGLRAGPASLRALSRRSPAALRCRRRGRDHLESRPFRSDRARGFRPHGYAPLLCP